MEADTAVLAATEPIRTGLGFCQTCVGSGDNPEDGIRRIADIAATKNTKVCPVTRFLKSAGQLVQPSSVDEDESSTPRGT